MIIDKAAQNNPVSFEARSALDDYIKKRQDAINEGQERIETEE